MVESSKEIMALHTGLLEEKAFLLLGNNAREIMVEEEGGGDFFQPGSSPTTSTLTQKEVRFAAWCGCCV